VACQNVPARERVQLQLTQTGYGTTGVLALPHTRVNVSGRISDDGTLTMAGESTTPTHTVRITGWRSTASGQSMYGTFSYSITPRDDRFGVVIVTASLENLTRE
jgi:hypothetical protein